MSNYTAQQFEDILFALAKNYSWGITGGVYHGGLRPRDSRAEDVVVAYVSGMAGDVQSAVLYVNIYVPDIDPWGNGVLVQDMARTSALEVKAAQFAATLTDSPLRWRLYGTIHTQEVNDIKQHAVVIPLQVDYCSETRL